MSSKGPTSATREHEKRILESILPPDLRHLVRGGSPGTIQVRYVVDKLLRPRSVAYENYSSEQQMKIKLEDEMRRSNPSITATTKYDNTSGLTEAELARKKAESRLFGLTGAQSDRIRQEMQRYATMRDPRLR